jgi:hypothetical protein
MQKTLIVAAAALILASPALAQKPTQPAASPDGELVAKLTAEVIGGVLDAHNLRYQVGTDDAGAPLVTITTGKSVPAQEFHVLFFECQQDQCEDALLTSWYRFPEGDDDATRIDKVNIWNRDHRWTRVYVDPDNDAVMEMDVNATGGIGVENLAMQIGHYIEAMSEFEQTISQ